MKIEVRQHARDQCEVILSGVRVAYVCFGDDKPINYLSKKTTGVALTIDQRIQVARFTRQAMSKMNVEREAKFAELAELSAAPVDASGDVCELQPVVGDIGKQPTKKSDNNTE